MLHEKEFEYFVFERGGGAAYPLLKVLEYSNPFKKDPLEEGRVVSLGLGSPIPKKPVMGDFLTLSPTPVVSKRVYDLLQPMNISGIQLVPVTITMEDGSINSDYHAIHVFHYIAAMDKEKSDYEEDYGGGYTVDSFLLDEKVLSEIPLQERLIFRLQESKSCFLFHKSIVDAIMVVNPTGVQFIKVEDWRL